MFEYHKTTYPIETSYAFVSYKIEDYPDGWLFDTEHMDDFKDWHKAKDKMFADVLTMACKHGCVGLWNGKSKLWYYLHPSTTHDCLQLTCWDEHGPVGHANVSTAEKLASEVNWNEFTAYRVA